MDVAGLLELLQGESYADFLGRLTEAAVIIFFAWLIIFLGQKVVHRVFSVGRSDPQKKKTLITLLNSVLRYVIFAMSALLLIQVFAPGFNIAPILAGAGVLGLAVGFGAQTLIKDVITGFFLMFEDQIRVGDYVSVNNGEVTGTVEEVGLRMTTIREWSGRKYYIANSEIRTVNNYNRRELRVIIRAAFPFEESPARIRDFLNAVCAEATEILGEEHLMKDETGHIVEPPQIYGVTDISGDERGGVFTIIAKTYPDSLWVAERCIRELIWQRAPEHGIRLAYPRHWIESEEHRRADA